MKISRKINQRLGALIDVSLQEIAECIHGESGNLLGLERKRNRKVCATVVQSSKQIHRTYKYLESVDAYRRGCVA